MQEQTAVDHQAAGLLHYEQSQEVSQVGKMSFAYNQASFTQALRMLDSDPVSLGNSQELWLGLVEERPTTQVFASSLWLSLNKSQESDSGVRDNGFL